MSISNAGNTTEIKLKLTIVNVEMNTTFDISEVFVISLLDKIRYHLNRIINIQKMKHEMADEFAAETGLKVDPGPVRRSKKERAER